MAWQRQTEASCLERELNAEQQRFNVSGFKVPFIRFPQAARAKGSILQPVQSRFKVSLARSGGKWMPISKGSESGTGPMAGEPGCTDRGNVSMLRLEGAGLGAGAISVLEGAGLGAGAISVSEGARPRAGHMSAGTKAILRLEGSGLGAVTMSGSKGVGFVVMSTSEGAGLGTGQLSLGAGANVRAEGLGLGVEAKTRPGKCRFRNKSACMGLKNMMLESRKRMMDLKAMILIEFVLV
ncbi:hypothetical protein ACET3Z_031260 [Daucus carota]